ncbi:hypothetical protein KQX54_018973 [Cotesia glomerata]|uniref:Uncharacterized protein n=1 Tax=Cotesia glomerata TaxID=32391 RepID=A0AAV7I0W2_COTGL|nr:hypothetical protein KQX54_018973 [Cotesia glomerata]
MKMKNKLKQISFKQNEQTSSTKRLTEFNRLFLSTLWIILNIKEAKDSAASSHKSQVSASISFIVLFRTVLSIILKLPEMEPNTGQQLRVVLRAVAQNLLHSANFVGECLIDRARALQV